MLVAAFKRKHEFKTQLRSLCSGAYGVFSTNQKAELIQEKPPESNSFNKPRFNHDPSLLDSQNRPININTCGNNQRPIKINKISRSREYQPIKITQESINKMHSTKLLLANDVRKQCLVSSREKWFSSILDNSEHEKVIAHEIEKKTEFNPNLPSHYKIPLNSNYTVDLNTAFGRDLLASTLYKSSYGNIYITLSQHFLTQFDSLLCGPSSLVMIANALGMDPHREWKYPWRWYDEMMLNKCAPCEHTSSNGCSLDFLVCMAKSNGLCVEGLRASLDWTIHDFRNDVKRSCSSFDQPIILNFSRASLGQTGTGHFSPLGAYNEEHDMVLVMDTARFKYPPYWTKLETMWEALKKIAVGLNKEVSGMPRGYMILRRPRPDEDISVYVRLPWQQARVRIKTLSDDNTSIYTLYLLKEFKKSWNIWLDKPNSLPGKTMSYCEDKRDQILRNAVDEILNFAKSAHYTENVNKGNLDFTKFHNEFLQRKDTYIFHVIKQKLSEHFFLNPTDRVCLNDLVFHFLNLIEIEEDSDGVEEEMTSLKSKENNVLHNGSEDEELDIIASLLATMLTFWPYSIEQKAEDGSNRCALQASVDEATSLVSYNRKKSIPEQINFVLKTVDHAGHEVIYEKKKTHMDR